LALHPYSKPLWRRPDHLNRRMEFTSEQTLEIASLVEAMAKFGG
jgi:hypothetical protein